MTTHKNRAAAKNAAALIVIRLFSFQEIAVFQCGYAHICRELPEKILVVDISAFFGNVGHIERRCGKVVFGFLYPCSDAVLMKTYTEAFLVNGTEAV